MGLVKFTLKAPGGKSVTVRLDNVPEGLTDEQIAAAVRARVPDIEQASGVDLGMVISAANVFEKSTGKRLADRLRVLAESRRLNETGQGLGNPETGKMLADELREQYLPEIEARNLTFSEFDDETLRLAAEELGGREKVEALLKTYDQLTYGDVTRRDADITDFPKKALAPAAVGLGAALAPSEEAEAGLVLPAIKQTENLMRLGFLSREAASNPRAVKSAQTRYDRALRENPAFRREEAMRSAQQLQTTGPAALARRSALSSTCCPNPPTPPTLTTTFFLR